MNKDTEFVLSAFFVTSYYFFGPAVQHRQSEERLCREATLLTVNHGGKLSAGVAAVFIMA